MPQLDGRENRRCLEQSGMLKHHIIYPWDTGPESRCLNKTIKDGGVASQQS